MDENLCAMMNKAMHFILVNESSPNKFFAAMKNLVLTDKNLYARMNEAK